MWKATFKENCSIFHMLPYKLCGSRKYNHTPTTEGIGISLGVGVLKDQKNLKKCMKVNWNFQRGGEVLEKIPCMGKVWIFSGATHSSFE